MYDIDGENRRADHKNKHSGKGAQCCWAGTVVGTVKGGQFRTHFKTGHGELADELEVGSGMRKRKKKTQGQCQGSSGASS